jgi:hypothetical protein
MSSMIFGLIGLFWQAFRIPDGAFLGGARINNLIILTAALWASHKSANTANSGDNAFTHNA